MKTTAQLTAILLLMVTTFSCDDLDELTEFNVTDDFTTTISVSASEDSEGQPQSITQSATLDISSNQDIQDNIDLIQDITLNSLTYEITNYTGIEDATLTEGSLTFGTESITLENINLEQSDIDNTIYTISDVSLLNAIATDLENNTVVSILVSGTVNATPVVFDVIVTFDVTATIDVL
ncbi:MAG: hypothetical protein ABJQ39_11165 [Winogradskyella arenosi]